MYVYETFAGKMNRVICTARLARRRGRERPLQGNFSFRRRVTVTVARSVNTRRRVITALSTDFITLLVVIAESACVRARKRTRERTDPRPYYRY